ncbi:hypothetical protein F5Y18DRAFT_124001 [Xylariaceae sp. FL1019]|nr:hypothetical protein F5Y18DRAFT_124001 [Xylariaceae sp. FL1019]
MSTSRADSHRHYGLMAYREGLQDEREAAEQLVDKFLSMFYVDVVIKEEEPLFRLHRQIARYRNTSWGPSPGEDPDHAVVLSDPTAWSARIHLTGLDELKNRDMELFPVLVPNPAEVYTEQVSLQWLRGMILKYILSMLPVGINTSVVPWTPWKQNPDDLAWPEYRILTFMASVGFMNMVYMEKMRGLKHTSDIILGRSPIEGGRIFPPPLSSIASPSTDRFPMPQQIAHSWCFNPHWHYRTLSFATIAATLSLVTLPDKSLEGSSGPSCDGRDLRWTIDTIQRFCRMQLPSEGMRYSPSSFGIYDDCWMFLSLTLACIEPIGPTPKTVEENDENISSGMLCDRRQFQVPVFGQFREFRVSVISRSWAGKEEDEPLSPLSPQPFVVNVILADDGWYRFRPEHPISMNLKRSDKGDEIDGIIFFQFVLIDLIDAWVYRMNESLIQVEESFEGRLVVENFDKLLNQPELVANMKAADRHSRFSMLCNMTLFLDTLEKWISAGPQSVRHLVRTWEQTYHGPDSQEDGRFTRVGVEILRNWTEFVRYIENFEKLLLDRL